jgi:hypothetical protein
MKDIFLFIFYWIGLLSCMAQHSSGSSIGDRDLQSVNRDSLANEIIGRVIKNKPQNDPDAILNTYSYNSYTKAIVSANSEAINGTVDSIFKRKRNRLKFKKIDSTNYIIKKQLEKSHLYIMEKVSNFAYSREKEKRETILGIHMAGFKKPIYEVLAIEMQSFSLYNKRIKVFGTDFTSPLGGRGKQTYLFNYEGVSEIQGRKNYIIRYTPKENKQDVGIPGVLYIDAETYAIQRNESKLDASVELQAIQEYTYFPTQNIWFPSANKIRVDKGTTDKTVTLFGKLRVATSEQMNDSSIMSTNQDDIKNHIYLVAQTSNFNINLNKPVTIERSGTAIELLKVASNRGEDFWKQYRTQEITTKELETYKAVDSLTSARNYENKLSFIRKFMVGYITTSYIDFDYKSLLKFNRYEGFRLGMSAVTNSNFSHKYTIHAYGAYGTKDKDFKYGFGIERRLDRYDDTRIGITHKNDLEESGSLTFLTDGRAFYLFEPRLFNLTYFHKIKDVSTYLTHDFNPKLNSRFQLSYQDVTPTYQYSYVNDGESYHNYQNSSITASIQWNPFNKYLQSDSGKTVIEKNYPQFSLQYSQAFKNVINSDLNYTKIALRAMHELRPLNKGVTSFQVVAGISFGDLPLTELYNASPNQPGGETILNRFSVAGRNSFETMYFNEFLSDKYAIFQARHTFNRFNISSWLRPEFALISRFGIGSTAGMQKHHDIEFNSMEKGYSESGLEVNKLFKGFGLSFMYRYGAYHLPSFDDNISLKFTYYLTLGF